MHTPPYLAGVPLEHQEVSATRRACHFVGRHAPLVLHRPPAGRAEAEVSLHRERRNVAQGRVELPRIPIGRRRKQHGAGQRRHPHQELPQIVTRLGVARGAYPDAEEVIARTERASREHQDDVPPGRTEGERAGEERRRAAAEEFEGHGRPSAPGPAELHADPERVSQRDLFHPFEPEHCHIDDIGAREKPYRRPREEVGGQVACVSDRPVGHNDDGAVHRGRGEQGGTER